MNVLICKLGATGDVVRTTPLLHVLEGEITWITAPKNTVLLHGIRENLRCLSWDECARARDRKYDLVINLEDSEDVAQYLRTVEFGELFGAYLDSADRLRYTDDSRRWFDLSLISQHGRQQADRLKLLNRQTYQELIFDGLGFSFEGETYLLPEPTETNLAGDVAIAPEAGPVWPMKKWAYFDQLKRELEANGLTVNVLQERPTLLEHLCDVQSHRCLVSGDSLPMHLGLGVGTCCVSLFTCTSPWEIYDYGIQHKILSPVLDEFFYQRGWNERATTAIRVDEVMNAVMTQLNASRPLASRIAP